MLGLHLIFKCQKDEDTLLLLSPPGRFGILSHGNLFPCLKFCFEKFYDVLINRSKSQSYVGSVHWFHLQLVCHSVCYHHVFYNSESFYLDIFLLFIHWNLFFTLLFLLFLFYFYYVMLVTVQNIISFWCRA